MYNLILSISPRSLTIYFEHNFFANKNHLVMSGLCQRCCANCCRACTIGSLVDALLLAPMVKPINMFRVPLEIVVGCMATNLEVVLKSRASGQHIIITCVVAFVDWAN